jgi:tRNA(Ile)-lysidine synthase
MQALQATLAASVSDAAGDALAVASARAGLTVLLHLAAHLAQQQGLRVHAFHVHHGLSPNADAWLAHAEDAARNVRCHCRRACPADNLAESGTEAAARKARYAALGGCAASMARACC